MRDITRLVLLSYTLLIFSPVFPVFADFAAHTFWLKQHLANVHNVYGKSHVNKELSNASKQTDKNKSSNSPKSAQEEYLPASYYLTFYFSNDCFIVQSYNSYTVYCPVSYKDSDYRPPRG